jgi:hypothetical protein
MISEPLYYSNKKVLEYWITYVEQCYDGVDILLYLLKKGICVKNYFIYDSIAICYETQHDFDKANDIYLKGFDNMQDNNEDLKKKYKEFELRMERRILRDVNNSSIDVSKIEREIYEEIKRKCNRNITKDKIGNKRMKRDVEGFDKEMWIGLLKMKIYNNKVEINDDGNNDYIGNKYMAVNYGEVPVYVDESCRRNFISKATKLVEIYKLLFNFLNENDEVFKSNQIQFNLELKRTMERKPYSWINRKVIDNNEGSSSSLNMNNNNYIGNDSKQLLHQEPYNAISYIEQEYNKKVYNCNSNNNNNVNSGNNVKEEICGNNNNNKTKGNKKEVIVVRKKCYRNNSNNNTQDEIPFKQMRIEMIKKEFMYNKNKYIESLQNMKNINDYNHNTSINTNHMNNSNIFNGQIDSDGDLCMDSDIDDHNEHHRNEIKKEKTISQCNNNIITNNNINTKSIQLNTNNIFNTISHEDLMNKVTDIEKKYDKYNDIKEFSFDNNRLQSNNALNAITTNNNQSLNFIINNQYISSPYNPQQTPDKKDMSLNVDFNSFLFTNNHGNDGSANIKKESRLKQAFLTDNIESQKFKYENNNHNVNNYNNTKPKKQLIGVEQEDSLFINFGDIASEDNTFNYYNNRNKILAIAEKNMEHTNNDLDTIDQLFRRKWG